VRCQFALLQQARTLWQPAAPLCLSMLLEPVAIEVRLNDTTAMEVVCLTAFAYGMILYKVTETTELFALPLQPTASYADGSVWPPCGDYASDPNQLLSNSAGGPPPGCPGGGPLDPVAYHNWGGIFE